MQWQQVGVRDINYVRTLCYVRTCISYDPYALLHLSTLICICLLFSFPPDVAIAPMVTSARTAISQKGSVAAHEDFSQKADNVSSHIFPKPSHIHPHMHPHTYPFTPSHTSCHTLTYIPLPPHTHISLHPTHIPSFTLHTSPAHPHTHPLHTPLTHSHTPLTHTPHTLTHTLTHIPHTHLLTHIPSPSQLVSAVHDVYNVVDKHYNPPPPPPRPPSPTPESKQPFSLDSFPSSLLKRNREPVIIGLGGIC